MKKVWSPSAWGALLTMSDWSVDLDGPELTVTVKGQSIRKPLLQIYGVSQKPGFAWATVFLHFDSSQVEVDGIPNEQAVEMVSSIRAELITTVKEAISTSAKPLVRWVESALKSLPTQRWITEEDIGAILQIPTGETNIGDECDFLIKHPLFADATKELPSRIRDALNFRAGGLRQDVERLNTNFLANETKACRQLFDRVEKNPLTIEQAHAVVCFDNRVLLVAAAGSGKTSTLIAKAAYAISRTLVPSEAILMLAFNSDAAKELQERILDRLDGFVPAADKIVARTFHAFGLSIIGEATGKKPALAPWLDKNNGLGEIISIIDALCESDDSFRSKWNLYQTVYAEDLGKFDKEEEPEDWDDVNRRAGFETLMGEIVKSREERMIANWLFFNGVAYVYEGEYEEDTADATHRQYRPDFFYPQANLYHEHFALDGKGNPPQHFTNYLEGVEWKRQVHAANNTSLFETTSASLRSGDAFEALVRILQERGVTLDPRPDRSIPGRRPLETSALAASFRVFQAHVKNNQLSIAELRTRLNSEVEGTLRPRHSLFVDLYEHISTEWDRRLRSSNYIDFEDMLNLAADHIEAGRWHSPYRLIMVDEFQDSSRARARLVKALVNAPHRYLFAVGDDWQGINRFSGADIGVMTEFEGIFGKGQQIYLTKTFRCPQHLCDLSRQFIMRNPAQIQKKVETTNPRNETSLICHSVAKGASIEELVEKHLTILNEKIASENVQVSKGGKVSVFILGRYRRNRPASLDEWQNRFGNNLSISYSTIHGSKGLEADYVLLLEVVQGRYGFPSQIEDDPVHQIAMPTVDPFPFAEERRLLYVAITRAKRLAMLYTSEHHVSEFLVELQGEPYSISIRSAQSENDPKTCPKCNRGIMLRRMGSKGLFWGCSRFPSCQHTYNDNSSNSAKGAGSSNRPRNKERKPFPRAEQLRAKGGESGHSRPTSNDRSAHPRHSQGHASENDPPEDLQRKTEELRKLFQADSLNYEQLRLVIDNAGRLHFSEDELKSMQQRLKDKTPRLGSETSRHPDRLVVFSKTDGQD